MGLFLRAFVLDERFGWGRFIYERFDGVVDMFVLFEVRGCGEGFFVVGVGVRSRVYVLGADVSL